MRRIWLRITFWWEWQQVVKALCVADETIAAWGWTVGDKHITIHGVNWKIWYKDNQRKYTYLYRY